MLRINPLMIAQADDWSIPNHNNLFFQSLSDNYQLLLLYSPLPPLTHGRGLTFHRVKHRNKISKL